MKIRYIFFTLTIILICSLIFSFFWFKSQLAPASSDTKSQSFIINQNASWNEIISNLHKQNLIKSPLAFKLLVKINKADFVQAGEYILNSSMGSQNILKKFIKGEVNEVWFRINEGFRITEIANKISEQKIFEKSAFENDLAPELYDFDFLKNLPQNSLEGFLYPDTYLIQIGSKPRDFINKVLENFQNKLNPYKEEIRRNKLSFYEILTLASIVEREASKKEDRDMIAGVYLKRLEIGMKFGSCPTVLYALGNWRLPITYEAIQTDSPYNTYKHYGLPPSPICNPSVSSIKAVLFPKTTEYLYFLAKDGITYYSKTYEAHLQKKQELGI